MAITWTVTITPIDVPTKTASIQAVRVDDSDGSTETHNIITAILETTAQKLAAMDDIWQQHLDYTARQAAIDAFVGALESQAEANLESREV